MRYTSIVLSVAAILIGLSPARAQEKDVLATLKAGHPRLILSDDDVARLKAQIEKDPLAKRWFEQLTKVANGLIDEPVAKYELIGPRLLQVSRKVFGRVTLLSGMYRLTGEKKYAERARDEMMAAAKFDDWHPSHFLDTAEMSNAIGIGYDWLYGFLSPDERATFKTAIVEKGLKPGIIYQSKNNVGHTRTNNWNQVCNGGLTVGALAVADEAPDEARQIIDSARKALPAAFATFAPDGGCEEGPGYWSYAMRYTVYYFAAIKSALGTDFDQLKSPGLADTGLFRIHADGPIGLSFNFADAGARVGRAAEMLWLAGAYDRPVYAAHERLMREDADKIDPFHLFFYNPSGSEADIKALPTAAMFKRINVAFLRSGWNDPSAAFVGFKGGDNTASHAHADIGTFVYDVDGVRWALDLAGDDYNLPGYFGKQRWDYYRLRTEGHNTLTIGNDNQNIAKSLSPIIAFSSKAGEAMAVADLTAAYAPRATRANRGMQLLDRQLLVQDEIEAGEPLDLVWNFHTDAKPTIDGKTAMLTQGAKKLAIRILEPAGASFKIVSANPPPPQAQQPKVSNLTIVQPEKTTSLRLVVLLAPASEKPADVKAKPLSEWK